MNHDAKNLFAGFGWTISAGASRELTSIDPQEVRRRLKSAGVVVFRGFDVDLEKFVDFTKLFAKDAIRHQATTVRPKVSEDGTVTEVLIGNQFIELHGEMYYLPRRPELLWLYCMVPAQAGGGTTLCDASELLNALNPETVRFLSDQPLKYHHVFPKESWTAFTVGGKIEEAIANLQRFSGVEKIEFDKANGVLSFDFLTPAVSRSVAGKDVFINSILNIEQYQHLKLTTVSMADGRLIPKQIVEEIRQTGNRVAESLKWQAGDFMVVENSSTMHGREAFEGPRKIITRFTMAA